MTAAIIYGIANCDTTKKAMAWFSKNKIPFSFHDYKLQGIGEKKLIEWCEKKGWEIIFNKRSTTWRELPEAVQKKLTGQETAIKIMMQHHSIIKRPVIETGAGITVGYDETAYKKMIR